MKTRARLVGACFSLDSVGINRREVVNEIVIQERSSETILAPSHVRAHREGALEALEIDQAEPPNRGARKPGQGHMQAGYPEVVSSEIAKDRRADGVKLTGRQYCDVRKLAGTSQALRSRRPQACMETSRARTERPRPCPPK